MQSEAIDQALSLRRGLLAWRNADPHVDRRGLIKAMRDNWDRRIGLLKFGGVWSVAMARSNERHPASCAAHAIGRTNWSGRLVTVEHAVPIRVLFEEFLDAETPEHIYWTSGTPIRSLSSPQARTPRLLPLVWRRRCRTVGYGATPAREVAGKRYRGRQTMAAD